MQIKINGVNIAKTPSTFSVTVLDLDNSESTFRSANGTLTRDRIAVKRQIDMEWGMLLTTAEISAILTSMGALFFTVTYLDPYTGTEQTKTFYVGNRQVPVAYSKNGVTMWGRILIGYLGVS